MDAETHARFARAQGMRIIKVGSHLWVEKRKFCLESIPPHRDIHVDSAEARSLFRRGYLVLRYTCDESEGVQSAQYICDHPQYGLESLESRTRNQVRQGLKNCAVRPVDFELLKRRGCAINRSVFHRQNRTGPAFLRNQVCWEQYMDYCKTTPDIEPYGAFVNDELCAYTLVIKLEDYAYLYHPFAETSSLHYRPMNALIFCVTQILLKLPGVRRVCYGLESLSSQPALEKFKTAMGFTAVPLRRKILLNPLAQPLVSDYAANLIRGIHKRVNRMPFLEAYLSFLEGYRRCTT